jgi:hypothetical protein
MMIEIIFHCNAICIWIINIFFKKFEIIAALLTIIIIIGFIFAWVLKGDTPCWELLTKSITILTPWAIYLFNKKKIDKVLIKTNHLEINIRDLDEWYSKEGCCFINDFLSEHHEFSNHSIAAGCNSDAVLKRLYELREKPGLNEWVISNVADIKMINRSKYETYISSGIQKGGIQFNPRCNKENEYLLILKNRKIYKWARARPDEFLPVTDLLPLNDWQKVAGTEDD